MGGRGREGVDPSIRAFGLVPKHLLPKFRADFGAIFMLHFSHYIIAVDVSGGD